MKLELKTQLLAAMKAYIELNGPSCVCDETDNACSGCALDGRVNDALAALEAAPVDDIAEKFAEAHAALSPLLGDTFRLTLNHIAARYGGGEMVLEWRVMAGKNGTFVWYSGGDRPEFGESLRELIKDIQKPSTACETCGQKNTGIYAHVHVEMT